MRAADQGRVEAHKAGPATGLITSGATLSLMRQVAITMLVVGGLTCLAGVWIVQSTPESRLAQGLIAAALIASGFLLLALRPNRRLLEGTVLWSIVLLSLLIALSEPIGMAPFFYLWPVVYAAYFSSLRVLILTFGSMVVTLTAALVVHPSHPLKLDTFVGTVATVGIMAALVARMTNREADLRARLAAAAETDALTGLLNRRSFDPQVALLVAEASARSVPLSLVMLDLDRFKELNDRYGHLAGDEALQAVAAVLASQSRDGDLVCRFGGEEFAVALPGASSESAIAYAERVATTLERLRARGDPHLTLSAGISSLGPGCTDVETLFQQADDALYAAKDAGRDRAALWTPSGIETRRSFGDAP